MTSLEKLDIGGICGVGRAGMQNLSLKLLNIKYNRKIVDVSFMSSLENLIS